MDALERVLLQPEGLVDAEAALFLLARTEHGTHSNNAANTWANLFLVELAFTPHPDRHQVASAPCPAQSTSTEDRLLALRD